MAFNEILTQSRRVSYRLLLSLSFSQTTPSVKPLFRNPGPNLGVLGYKELGTHDLSGG